MHLSLRIDGKRRPEGLDPLISEVRVVIFFFPYNPHPPPPISTNPPGRPTREDLIPVHFGSVWLRSGPFGSVSGLFRVRFGGVGWDRGGIGERGFCKGKEYHWVRVYREEAEKASCGETVVQKGVFGESVSSPPP